MISYSGLVQFGIVPSFILQSGHNSISGSYSDKQVGQPYIEVVLPCLVEAFTDASWTVFGKDSSISLRCTLNAHTNPIAKRAIKDIPRNNSTMINYLSLKRKNPVIDEHNIPNNRQPVQLETAE